ncbi:hypothetical protein IscW_ISCW010545, partial [Ixodes scapularis]
QPSTRPRKGRPSDGDDPTRLTARHFMSVIPPLPQKQTPQEYAMCAPRARLAKRSAKNHATCVQCARCHFALYRALKSITQKKFSKLKTLRGYGTLLRLKETYSLIKHTH